MLTENLSNQISRHYLEVQALTPVSVSAAPASLPFTQNQDWVSLATPAFIIFVTLLLLGMVALILTHTRNVNKLLIVISLAFITSIIPLGMRALNQKTQIPSQADMSTTPTHVIVGQVTSSGFNLSWSTAAPTIGAISLKKVASPDHLKAFIPETPESKMSAHFIPVTQLQPNTTYEVLILSNDIWYGKDGLPLQITTQP